jgi:hypothetical protein
MYWSVPSDWPGLELLTLTWVLSSVRLIELFSLAVDTLYTIQSRELMTPPPRLAH